MENSQKESTLKKVAGNFQSNLMAGVAYMIPVVIIGGIFLALSLATGTPSDDGMVITSQFWLNMNDIGTAGMAMMIPVLAGFISYGIAGRPGLAPGLVLGYVANNPIGASEVKSGFLGAMILGLASGYLVKYIKSWKVPKILRPVMPIFIIPLLTTLVLSLLYIYILANPLGWVMDSMNNVLLSLNGGSTVLFAIVLGSMLAFDMGGPFNKIAALFAFGLMADNIYTVTGIFGIAVCTPPLGLGLATLIGKNKFTKTEKDSGKAALVMGLIGITEGAIPFAATDPLRVIPSIMVGSAAGAVVGALGNVANYAPHGGLIVLPVVENKLWYVAGVIVGTLVTAIMVLILKPKKEESLESGAE